MNTVAQLYPVSETVKRSFQLAVNDGVLRREPGGSGESGLLTPLSEAFPTDVAESTDAIYAELRREGYEGPFSLGTDITNTIVLGAYAKDDCWINQHHCRLFPVPDSEQWSIENASSSTFKIRELHSTDSTPLAQRDELRLKIGWWSLELGRGLEILVQIKAADAQAIEASQVAFPGIKSPPPKILSRKSELQARQGRSKARTGQSSRSGPRLAVPKTPAQPSPRNATPSYDNECVVTDAEEPIARAHSTPATDAFSDQAFQVSVVRKDESSYEKTSKTSAGPSRVLGTTTISEVRQELRGGVAVSVKRFHDNSMGMAYRTWSKEVEMLKKIKPHPNVCQYESANALQLSITLGYAPGENLAFYTQKTEFGRTSTLTVDACDTIWTQIVSALEHVHQLEIIHCDVKPGNIIWCPLKKQATLIDFGFARLESRPFQYCGTPCYVAPEFYTREASARSDVWALGVVLAFAFAYIPCPSEYWELKSVWDKKEDATKMHTWTARMTRIRASIEVEGIRPLLAEMLENNPWSRPTSAMLKERLPVRQALLAS